MNVVRARALGLCFGVRDALAATAAVAHPARTTIYGDLVHNPAVVSALTARGFASLPETQRDLPATSDVMITAHGISDQERRKLLNAGKTLVDTTCPLVRRAHDAARTLQQEGRFVIVVGKADHVEVRGITGDLDRCAVVATPDQARNYGEPRLGVVFQTTTPPRVADEIVAAIRAANPGADCHVLDTICRPTRERQDAMAELLAQVDAVVVVGGHHSNNTRQLVKLADEQGIPAFHVESAADLDLPRLAPYRTIGLTAGTSTLDETIEEVARALEAM